MTSALRREGVRKYPNFANKQYIHFGQRGRGVKKSQHVADVIYVSPLTWITNTEEDGRGLGGHFLRPVREKELREGNGGKCHHNPEERTMSCCDVRGFARSPSRCTNERSSELILAHVIIARVDETKIRRIWKCCQEYWQSVAGRTVWLEKHILSLI